MTNDENARLKAENAHLKAENACLSAELKVADEAERLLWLVLTSTPGSMDRASEFFSAKNMRANCRDKGR